MPSPTSKPLALAATARAQLLRHARAGYPQETCGVLVGRTAARGPVVCFASRGRNLREAHDRYELDPSHLLRMEQLAEETGLEVLGVWHSHPDHPAQPSETDRRQAWPGWAYVIVSVRGGEPDDLRSWRLRSDPCRPGSFAFAEEPVVIAGGPGRGAEAVA